jgi:hypothetical protein
VQFEGVPASGGQVGRAPPPTPYAGLAYTGVDIIPNPDTSVDVLTTTQGVRFITTTRLSTPQLAVVKSGDTFDLTSALVGLNIITHNTLVFPAQDGTLVFTGTRADGSTVSQTVKYVAGGSGTTKVGGIVLSGRAVLQGATFGNLKGLVKLTVAIQSSALDSALVAPALLSQLQVLDLASAANGISLDALAYVVHHA